MITKYTAVAIYMYIQGKVVSDAYHGDYIRWWIHSTDEIFTWVPNWCDRRAPNRLVASPRNHCSRNQKDRASSPLPVRQFFTNWLHVHTYRHTHLAYANTEPEGTHTLTVLVPQARREWSWALSRRQTIVLSSRHILQTLQTPSLRSGGQSHC